MNKIKMASRTIESFIRKLQNDGHPEYASELRSIIAMSRRRRKALQALNDLSITLLVHLLKYIALPMAKDRNKWRGEIKGYLDRLNIKNKSPQGTPWLDIATIGEELNDDLSSPNFYDYMGRVLEDYPARDSDKVLSLLKSNSSLKNLHIVLSYDNSNNLQISVEGEIL